MNAQLPIDMVPGTKPPKFVWSQAISDLSGNPRRIECSGELPQSIETPVVDLIRLAKQLLRDNAGLQEQIEALKSSPKKGGK